MVLRAGSGQTVYLACGFGSESEVCPLWEGKEHARTFRFGAFAIFALSAGVNSALAPEGSASADFAPNAVAWIR